MLQFLMRTFVLIKVRSRYWNSYLIHLAKMWDPYDLPKEVTSSTHSFVGMLGLEVSSKLSHQSIWEAFTANRRPDRTPLTFKLLNDDFDMPIPKPKRQTYDCYIPKGIFKSNWINKYLKEVPAVITVFADLDWNDVNWLEKKNNLALKVQSVREKIGQRNCRIALVLVQSEAGVPGEDTGAAEKAATLCTTCNIPAKLLYTLPHSDTHLLGHIVRLENVLAEIAGGFYLGQVKTIRGHKDFLNKTSHQLLFVRHNFKLGFHHEMRNDLSNAVKFYAQAYSNLVELRCTDTNLHEIRTCAAIINYKLCRLDFLLNLPRDAIAQFRRHIDIFRQKTGPKELIFEHYAWLSKQYKIFGDIFEEAVNTGLPAVQTQHPGFYYQQAAQYAVTRRKMVKQICKDTSGGTIALLDDWDRIEYFGQRPWRPGKHLLEPPEAERESDGIKALQYNDLMIVVHSDLVIPLFSSAIGQFKKYRCPRIKRHLMVLMAEEYHHAKDPGKALALLNHVMWDYRNERWWTLLSSSSLLALDCAYQTASVSDYVSLVMEVLGPRVSVDLPHKERAFNNLQKLLKAEAPDPEPNLSLEAIESASGLWTSFFRSQLQSIQVDMTTIVPCVEVRCSFQSNSINIDQRIPIKIYIRNTFSNPLQLSRLNIGTSVPKHNDGLVISDQEKLLLEPNIVKELEISFQPNVNDINSTIKITQVVMKLGQNGFSINLLWTGVGNEGVTINAADSPAFKEFSILCKNEFNTLKLIPEISVLSREPNLETELKYDEKALVWEWLPININLINKEESSINDVSLTLELHSSADQAFQQTTQITFSPTDDTKRGHRPVCQRKVSNISAGGNHSLFLYVKSLTAATRPFSLTINYNSSVKIGNDEVSCLSVFQKNFDIEASIPFSVNIDTQSLKFEQVSNVIVGDSFLVVPKINCTSHVPIVFTTSSLSLAPNIEYSADAISQIEGTELIDGEVGVDCFCVKTNTVPSDGSSLPLGQYLLSWQRLDDENASPVGVSVGLPSMHVETCEIWVDAEIPAQGSVRTPFVMTYILSNKGYATTELLLSMHVSDLFVFAGHKEVRLRVLPGESERISYILSPLLAGTVQLPKLTLTTDPAPPPHINYEMLLDRILPTHMYIMPQAKSPKSNENSSVPLLAGS